MPTLEVLEDPIYEFLIGWRQTIMSIEIRIRVTTWNIGTLIVKLMELRDKMVHRKINMYLRN